MLDVQFSFKQPDLLSEEDVLHMLTRKTAALLEYSAWCGACIGLAGAADIRGFAANLGKFASLCGTAFQLHDDLLGLTGDEQLLGKPVGSDVREGKTTLIMHKALARASSAERTVLLSALGNSAASRELISDVLHIVESTNAQKDVVQLANLYIDQALTLLYSLPDSSYRRLLSTWATFLLVRKH